ncbi:MAG: SAM hydrolase/SAM-dependent halogenase family protein [Thermoplasmatota archaeon]
MNVVTLTTDIGWRYAAQMKGRILSIAPEAVIVDVAHDVAPQDIMEGAFVLYAVAPQFDKAVHISVVDPGVGTSRKAIIAACDHGCLVGPDNGVLIPAARRLGLRQVYEITAEEYMAEAIAPTFHGRDVFAPVAAHLLQGVSPADMGTPYDAYETLDFEPGLSGHEGSIIYIDTFGNLITSLHPDGIDASYGDIVAVTVAGTRRELPYVPSYGHVDEGKLLLTVSSAGLLEVACRNRNAQEMLQVCRGDSITVHREGQKL